MIEYSIGNGGSWRGITHPIFLSSLYFFYDLFHISDCLDIEGSMPARRVCPSLYKLGVAQNAKILLTGCQNIDSLTDPFKVETILGKVE